MFSELLKNPSELKNSDILSVRKKAYNFLVFMGLTNKKSLKKGLTHFTELNDYDNKYFFKDSFGWNIHSETYEVIAKSGKKVTLIVVAGLDHVHRLKITTQDPKTGEVKIISSITQFIEPKLYGKRFFTLTTGPFYFRISLLYLFLSFALSRHPYKSPKMALLGKQINLSYTSEDEMYTNQAAAQLLSYLQFKYLLTSISVIKTLKWLKTLKKPFIYEIT